MRVRTNLDMDVLRTFVTGFELGSFAKAAERLGRSQSAISTQLRKLEEQVGERLVYKCGRGLGLTTAGESLLSYAKRLLELNDEAVETVRGTDLEGWVRLGLPQDFAERWLPGVLRRFARLHPKIKIEVRVDSSQSLIDQTALGKLDAALAWSDRGPSARVERIADLPMHWIGPPDWPPDWRLDWSTLDSLAGKPLPFAAFSPPCAFRSAAIDALDAAGISWRIAFTSPSLSGLWAAAQGGLGLIARTTIDMPDSLVALDPRAYGLPPLPKVPLALHCAEAEPAQAVKLLTEILLEGIDTEFGADKGVVAEPEIEHLASPRAEWTLQEQN